MEITEVPAERARRPLRRDAVENRERLLAAAATVMLRDGMNVPIASIAAEAKVGVGTLYRRYANREALLEDLESRAYQIVINTIEVILEQDVTGLRSVELFLEATIEHRSQLILPLHGAPVGTSPRTNDLRDVLDTLTARLVEKGHRDGTIRKDVRSADLVIFGALLAQPLATVENWDALARRQKVVFLRGIAAE